MKKLAGLFLFSVILVLSYGVCSGESGDFPFSVSQIGGTTEYVDETSGIKASVATEILDNIDLQSLRDYYNDKKSSEEELFDRYVKLQRSYIPAMQDLFTASFLYGEQDSPLAESNMKLFYEGSETVFGRMSAIYLYNIFKSDGLQTDEETHIDISVPSRANRTLFTVRITMKAGSLDEESIGKITALLAEIHLEDMSPQTRRLQLFKETDALDAANAGIYPARYTKGQTSSTIEDARAGFVLSVPSGFVPYMLNGVGGRLQYLSYKIDPNHIFSLSAQPMEKGDDLESSVAGIRALENWEDLTDEGWRRIGEKDFYYVKYDDTADESPVHVTDYFTADHSLLYRLQLRSRLAKPSALMIREFESILGSFRTMAPEIPDLTVTPLQATYANREEGYSFSYPENWELTEVSENIEYDRLKLVFPELSGPLEITVSEGELRETVGPEELPSCITGKSGGTDDANVIKYAPPYEGNPVKVLSLSSRTEGSAVYVYRLLDYLDPYGRNRLTYGIDIIKGTKIYSMFSTIGEYETAEGGPRDASVAAAINAVASSFRSEDTPQSLARSAAGETRNRKVVFVEEWLQKKVDPKLKVARAGNTAADGSLYVKAVNAGGSGYYKVLPDFASNSLTILDRTLTSMILKTELEKIIETYQNRIITRIYTSEADMTLRIDSSTDRNSPVFTRLYRVDVVFSDEGIQWKTTRPNHEQELRLECKVFLFMYLWADVDMQYDHDNVFKNMSAYTAKSLTYRTLVHAVGSRTDDFVTLEIDTLDDNISVVSVRPMDDLLNEIDKNLGFGRDGYQISSYSFDNSNFILKLTLKSETDGSLKSENLKIQYNPERQMIDYNVLDS